VSLYSDRHVAVVREEQVVPDTGAAFDEAGPALAEDRGSVVMATGPSATGDMGALVQGVHGPSEVHVIVVESGGERAVNRSDDRQAKAAHIRHLLSTESETIHENTGHMNRSGTGPSRTSTTMRCGTRPGRSRRTLSRACPNLSTG